VAICADGPTQQAALQPLAAEWVRAASAVRARWWRLPSWSSTPPDARARRDLSR
jgi:hypothetical protein